MRSKSEPKKRNWLMGASVALKTDDGGKQQHHGDASIHQECSYTLGLRVLKDERFV
jgi:hypothetical protein